MGVATYGRCFTLADPGNTQLYAPTKDPGLPGPYTRAPGFLGYNEVGEIILIVRAKSLIELNRNFAALPISKTVDFRGQHQHI